MEQPEPHYADSSCSLTPEILRSDLGTFRTSDIRSVRMVTSRRAIPGEVPSIAKVIAYITLFLLFTPLASAIGLANRLEASPIITLIIILGGLYSMVRLVDAVERMVSKVMPKKETHYVLLLGGRSGEHEFLHIPASEGRGRLNRILDVISKLLSYSPVNERNA